MVATLPLLSRRHVRSIYRTSATSPPQREKLAAVVLRRAAQRGLNLGSLTAKFLELLDTYGAAELEQAIREINEREVVHVPAVRQVLEQRRHAQGRPMPLPIPLADERLRDLAVRPHDLRTYDNLGKDDDDEHDR